MKPYERLGAFYLGREYDLAADERLENLLMYDARDLTTHAVCVGMTGSGKTGLCVDLLEEAAIDGVPALIIDPKGDLTNLMLTFPGLQPADFKPWVNVDDARRRGMTVEEYADYIANTWREGLADWEQEPERTPHNPHDEANHHHDDSDRDQGYWHGWPPLRWGIRRAGACSCPDAHGTFFSSVRANRSLLTSQC